MDICTGTGSSIPSLLSNVGENGLIVGLDFSSGMLGRARPKLEEHPNTYLVQAEVANMPFRSSVFNAVTCSHAFYELKGDSVHRCLQETVRVLKPSGRFVMMEHEIPKNIVIRVLFYIRLFSMGRKRALEILRQENMLFRKYFGFVKKVKVNAGRSKILIGQKTELSPSDQRLEEGLT